MIFISSARLRIEKDVIVRIVRNLQSRGTVSVVPNQEVIPSDVVGTAFVSAGFRTINLADLLKVAAAEVQKYLKRPLGQRIYKGELLAYKEGGLWGGKKVITAPTDGVLEFLNPKTGELRMTFLPKMGHLPAGVYGIVESVDSSKGQVVIRTQASLIHGMFGSGRLREGILRMVGKREEMMDKDLVKASYAGQILAGSSLVFRDTIAASVAFGVNGIICGGINAKDYKGLVGGRLNFTKKMQSDIGISILVCEGFGPVPLGEDIHGLLGNYDGRFVCLDGNAGIVTLPSFDSSIILKVKNSKLPLSDNFLSSQNYHQSQPEQLKKGIKVRVVGNSYLGVQGQIMAVDSTQTVLPSGIKTFLALVETKRRKIRLPVANLEIISEA